MARVAPYAGGTSLQHPGAIYGAVRADSWDPLLAQRWYQYSLVQNIGYFPLDTIKAVGPTANSFFWLETCGEVLTGAVGYLKATWKEDRGCGPLGHILLITSLSRCFGVSRG